jgi:glutamine synthetase type III
MLLESSAYVQRYGVERGREHHERNDVNRCRFEKIEQLFEVLDVAHDRTSDKRKLPGYAIAFENLAALASNLHETSIRSIGTCKNKSRYGITELRRGEPYAIALDNAGLFQASNALGYTGCGERDALSNIRERLAPVFLQRAKNCAIDAIQRLKPRRLGHLTS